MPMLTAAQIAKIRQKEAATPDALKRNPLSNYFEGYFFVTLNTRGEAPILSEVVGKVGAPEGEPDIPTSAKRHNAKSLLALTSNPAPTSYHPYHSSISSAHVSGWQVPANCL